MAYNRDNSVNPEQIAEYLVNCVKRVESASDSEVKELNEIKKLFKKNVPFSRRGYVTAYLIKNACGNFKGNRFQKNKDDKFNKKFDKYEKTDRSQRNEERAPRVKIDDDLAKTIFIGIGRNRRVYPRDLKGILISVGGVENDRIGDIHILSNYSFVQLYAEDCDKVIAALNGYDFRGCKLSVSYSRKKDEAVAEAPAKNDAAPKAEAPADEDRIPANVSNESSGIAAENTEEQRIAQEQSQFAASQVSTSEPVTTQPYSETTDDGQVKSHFGDGAAY